MADLAKEITEFLAGEREPFRFDSRELCHLVIQTAAYSSMWPKASFAEWQTAVKEAIKRGLLEDRNGKLGVRVKEQEPKPEQLGLF